MRKTIKRSEFLENMNRKLESDRLTGNEKAVICMCIESVLLEIDSYNGFQFKDNSAKIGTKEYYERVYM